ncbi:hypothetical protein NCTGTJJY_CDS0005 [Serratia phage 92A1]|nr:hypothetical protein NCTGTJJY_CDS0005 [Serratia phage 92A1]
MDVIIKGSFGSLSGFTTSRDHDRMSSLSLED